MSGHVGAVILAGGQSIRMGQDKALMSWNGRRAIDIAVDVAKQAGADRVVIAGRDYGHAFVNDIEPGEGPARALLNAIAQTPDIDRFLVLQVDAPLIGVADLAALLAVSGAGATYLGQPLPMQVQRDAALRAAGSYSLRDFVRLAGLTELEGCSERLARIRGANTPAEAASMQMHLTRSGGCGT